MAFCQNGAPQGCVLSPLLYILYTNDCRSQHVERHRSEIFDDTVVISLLHKEESEHGSVVDEFVTRCDEASLILERNHSIHHLRSSSKELALNLGNIINISEQ